MRPLALTAALLALLLAPAASAKEITAVAACGADDCVTTRDPAVLRLMMDGGTPLAGPNGEPGVVRLRAKVTEPGQGVIDSFAMWWAPSSRLLVAEDGAWMRPSPAGQAALAGVTGGLGTLPWSATGLAAPAPDEPPAPAPADGGAPSWLWLLLVLPVAGVAAYRVAVAARASSSAGSTGSPAT